ncbi:MAG: hypothetical protein RIK87_28455 [Fuerstiella sp.]
MSKKQVILMSLVVAIPAVGLLAALVMGGINHGGNMFSGLMTVFVAITGLLVLTLGLSPIALWAFYPTEGFAAAMPAAPPPTAPGQGAVDDDEMADEDGFEDDEFQGDEFADGDEEMFDDDGFEDEEFEDEDEWA